MSQEIRRPGGYLQEDRRGGAISFLKNKTSSLPPRLLQFVS